MRRLLPLVVVGLVLGLAVPAVAAPPVTETIILKGVTETFVDVAPTCEMGGPLYEITITYNSVEHETVFDDGRVHATFTQTGTFVAVPLDPSDPGGSGHFAIWGGFNQNGTSVNGTSPSTLRACLMTAPSSAHTWSTTSMRHRPVLSSFLPTVMTD